ncbi:hypothetical protein OFE56_000823 [Salmonella enterica subsp. enterica serovar Montevideo]|nr:hypothetical protein [Salmonella enterica subsp. enterica serovar Montevideo]EKI6288703.1 hypothetical protein [Salmonella enterica]EIU1237131.1 hypothetical protein [Salmonella enterica subsp. enterica serovar Montevideo]EIW9432735.1 hypothetical protein [Salmonella enterica subsp. enterica serovar Montevideo]EJC1492206.1 hypothetical protein [Salmonella enterica subsp. enterica serovar Montevideo]
MSAQRRKIARHLEKSPSLKRELSEMAVESWAMPCYLQPRIADALRDDFILD